MEFNAQRIIIAMALVTMHPEGASFLSSIYLCRSEAHGDRKCIQITTNAADRHFAHRNSRSALSAPRGGD